MSDTGTDEQQFRVTLPAIRNLPTQLACAVVANRYSLSVVLVVVPLVLLAATLLFSERVARLYFGWCVGVVALTVLFSYRYYRTTTGIDTTAERLSVAFEPGGRFLDRFYSDASIDLSTIASVSFVRVGDLVVARLNPGTPLVAYRTVVPADRIEEVTGAFEACGVRTAGEPHESTRQIRLLLLLAASVSVVLPGAVLAVRPDLFTLNAFGIVGALVLFVLAVSRLWRLLVGGSRDHRSPRTQ